MKKNRKTLKLMIRTAQISAVILVFVLAALFIPRKIKAPAEENSSKWQDWLGNNQLHSVVYAFENGMEEGQLRSEEPVPTMESDINPQDAMITVKVDDAQTNAVVEIQGISSVFGVKTAVWSEQNGQDDLQWYDAQKDTDGTFRLTIPIKNHHTDGNYMTDVYVVRSDSSTYAIGRSNFSIQGPEPGMLSFDAVNGSAGVFALKLTNARSVNSLEKAEIEVWSQEKRENAYTYQAEIGADGTVTLQGNLANHNYMGGTYYAVATITDANGIKKQTPTVNADILTPSLSVSQSANAAQTEYELILGNLIENSVSQAEFEVYSKDGGKDDLVVYAGEKVDAFSFKTKAIISKHHTAGDYQVDVYGTRSNGKRQLLGTTSFHVDGPSCAGLTLQEKNESDEYFKMRVNGAVSASGIAQVRFLITRLSDQKQESYDGMMAANGVYDVIGDIKDQTESVDSYKVTAYVKDNNGIEIEAGTQEVTMAQLSNGRYKIMGQSRTNVSQMASYFLANASYPAFYAGSDAPSINDFCQIFVEECEREGVRAEVAFCQTMKETGYLKFGGDVSISQFNFAGIGATGNGEPGYSFSSVREGIRAQIQHLKAYASTDKLSQSCVDPRFSYVKRGTAPYVEWLGIQENPNGGGWAAGANYGPSIVNDYIRKLFSY